MPDIFTLSVIFLVFILAGTVKGIIGLGLPTVSLALLALVLDLPGAMTLILAPSIFTNIWQIFAGANPKSVFMRIRLFLVLSVLTVWLGALALNHINLAWLSMLLGLLLTIYAISNLAGNSFSVKTKNTGLQSMGAGILNGIFTGMTGSSVVPGVMYLQALNFNKDELLQAMGMLFALSTLSLAFALGYHKFLSFENSLLSLLALIPSLAGMAFGQKIRKKLSEKVFRRIFFISLLILGLYIIFSKLRLI